MKLVHIVEVPLDLGGGRRSVDMGPSSFRIAGLDARLAALGHRFPDRGDLPTPIREVKGAGDPRKKFARGTEDSVGTVALTRGPSSG